MSTIKRYQDLTFTDDFMFCKVLEDNPDLCQRILELILGTKIKEIRFKNKQQVIAPNPEKKSIRLDVMLDDESGTVYDLEMQTQDRHDLPKRTRAYQSIMDVDMFSRGGKYCDLPGSYIVFICTFDPFNRGLHKYTFRERCKEDPALNLEDGTCKVFINAKSVEIDMTDDMRAFIDFLNGKEASSDLTVAIERGMNFAKNNKVWEMEYMQFINYWDDVAEDAHKEGFAKGHAEGLAQGHAEGLAEGHAEGLAEGLAEGHAEGHAEGLAKGHAEGLAAGENLFASLADKLAEDSRIDDIRRAASDPEYRQQLYKEYGLI